MSADGAAGVKEPARAHGYLFCSVWISAELGIRSLSLPSRRARVYANTMAVGEKQKELKRRIHFPSEMRSATAANLISHTTLLICIFLRCTKNFSGRESFSPERALLTLSCGEQTNMQTSLSLGSYN
jgi:hypothetical protein